MTLAILITLSLIALGWSLWIFIHKFALYRYKKSKKYEKRKHTIGRTLSLVFGPILLVAYSASLLFGLGAVVILDRLRPSGELNTFADTIASTNVIQAANSSEVKLTAKGYDDSNFNYYALKIKPSDGSTPTFGEGNRVVIFHHGLVGNRFKFNDYANQLARTTYLNDSANTTFVAYDAIGWSDGLSRGKTMLGVKAAVELKNVVESVTRDLKPSEIIIYGVSMGGGTVYNFLNNVGAEGSTFLTDNKVTKVIIDSGYFDLQREFGFYGSQLVRIPGALFAPMASWMYGLDQGVPFQFNAKEVVSRLPVDLMLLHALKDRTVDAAFTCEMDAAREANGLGGRTLTWTVDEATHADLQTTRPNEFNTNVNNFLSTDASTTPFADSLTTVVGDTGCRT